MLKFSPTKACIAGGISNPPEGAYKTTLSEKYDKTHCYAVEHHRKGRITLVDCLNPDKVGMSFLERRAFQDAKRSPKDQVTGPYKRLFFYSFSLGEQRKGKYMRSSDRETIYGAFSKGGGLNLY